MTRILFIAASLGLAASGAQACDFMKSATNVDTSATASVSKQEPRTPPMSTPATVATAETVQSDAVMSSNPNRIARANPRRFFASGSSACRFGGRVALP